MVREINAPVYIALAHYPVVDRNGAIIASAVTNLDLHDIARAARTYGVQAFYVITPLVDQRQLIDKIVAHWTTGVGARFNPARRAALELIRVMDHVDDAIADISRRENRRPRTVATSASVAGARLDFDGMRAMLNDETPCLLIFGTAWGLTDAFMATADYILAPIVGPTEYNHLSVRAAAAVILDRLLARRCSAI